MAVCRRVHTGALYVLLILSAAACQQSRPEPPAVIVNPPDAVEVDPAPYLAAFPLVPPDLPRPDGTAPAGRALERALARFRAGEYAAAATALDSLLADHPGDARVQLYLGIARLFQDEPQNALELLRPLEFNAPPAVAAEAAWYGLVGIARLRDPSGVEAEAQSLCQRGWASSPRACAALRDLRARLGSPPRP